MNMRRRRNSDRKILKLALTKRNLGVFFGITAFIAALAQLALGASPLVVTMALVSVGAGLLGFVGSGAYNLGSWVALFYVLGNVLIALYAKTILGQALDSNLVAPVYSFFALAVTSTSLLAALVLVKQVGLGRPLFKGASEPQFLSFQSWACFGLGALFWLLNRRFQDPSGSGFGGISLFRDLLLMAVICRTAMLLERSGDSRSFDGRLAMMIAVSAFFGLIDNSKTLTALVVISYFATMLFYRRGLPVRSVVVLALGGLLFTGVIAPMVHALRAMGQQEMNLSQRAEFVASNLMNVLEVPDQLNRYELLAAGQFQHSYYNYFGNNGAGQILIGRYASVQQIDPVIAEVNRQGPRGGVAVWPALARLVPSFIYPDKPEHAEAYDTLVYYGLVDPKGGKFPTLPLAGQAYAGYGVFGLLIIPFLTFLAFLLCIKKLGWGLYRNVYAIFFFCDFLIVYVSQGDLSHYAGASLRGFPLFSIVFWLIAQCFHFAMRVRHHSRPVRRAPLERRRWREIQELSE